jgi:acyl carrier protein
MGKLLDVIKEGIEDIFPEAADMVIEPDTRLGEIPEWDSMNAINLQTFLEKKFPVDIPIDILTEDTTVGELIRYIERSIQNKQEIQ